MGSYSAWPRLPRSPGSVRVIVATDDNLNLQRLGARGQWPTVVHTCKRYAALLCHDRRHLVTWLVRGELTGNATPPIGMQIERTRTWLLPGNQTNSKSPRSCRCARMCFLFNHSSGSSSPTLPETQKEQVENKQPADDYSPKLKIGAWISHELPISTAASPFSHVCASTTSDWCIRQQHSIAHHYVFSDRPRHKFEAPKSDNADASTTREVPTNGPPNWRCHRSPGSQQGSQFHLNGHA